MSSHRSTNLQSAAMTLGDWRVQPSLNLIERAGQTMSLQPQSMDVLVYLAGRAGEVVSSDELLDAIWPSRIVGDDAVHRRIAHLRRQLQDDCRHPRYIQTVPKRGYRVIAEVTPAAAAIGLAVPSPLDADQLQSLLTCVELLRRAVCRLLDQLPASGGGTGGSLSRGNLASRSPDSFPA